MKIVIVGAGNVGGGLAAAATKAGHNVVISAADPASAAKTAADATNPLNDSYSDLTTTGVSAAEALQQQAPDAKVVKALNTVFASRYATPTEDGQPLDAFLAFANISLNARNGWTWQSAFRLVGPQQAA